MSKTYYYTSTNGEKVARSRSEVLKFLASRGHKFCPRGYQVDHIEPLFLGGADTADNMQLLTIEAHKLKTANEAVLRQKLIRSRNGRK